MGEYIIDVSKSPSINEVSYFISFSNLRKVHVISIHIAKLTLTLR